MVYKLDTHHEAMVSVPVYSINVIQSFYRIETSVLLRPVYFIFTFFHFLSFIPLSYTMELPFLPFPFISGILWCCLLVIYVCFVTTLYEIRSESQLQLLSFCFCTKSRACHFDTKIQSRNCIMFQVGMIVNIYLLVNQQYN